MNVIVIGSGMMGRAIAYDLSKFSKFDNVSIADKDRKTVRSAEKFLKNKEIHFLTLNVGKTNQLKKQLLNFDIAISAVPYRFNYMLAKIAIQTKTHFLDLGGNNDIVEKERRLSNKARRSGVTIIPDCGLAPGLVSVIVRDIVEELDSVEYVRIRVGGLPVDPTPPLNYQIVFSPYGLINEYVEDAIVLDRGKIVKKSSMTEIEKLTFPKPFGEMEAFLTSGGCSTLPYTYKDKIGYLDYKTIRYPGHCEKFKTLIDLGLSDEKTIKIDGQKIIPRELLVNLLLKNLPSKGKDVVLMKTFAAGLKDGRKINVEYTMIDYYDEKNGITAMMRTTGYPVSIIAQMIEQEIITERGVYCPEEIVPPKPFFKELKKRRIIIEKKME